MNLLTYNNINSGELHIIDQDEATKDYKMVWKISDVHLITVTEEECLSKSALDFQSHFMENKMKVLFGDYETAMEIMGQQFMDTVQDLRCWYNVIYIVGFEPGTVWSTCQHSTDCTNNLNVYGFDSHYIN